MLLPLDKYITLPIHEFCSVTGLGSTLVREMIRDGRLKSFRAGRKKLLIVVQSYLDLIAKQAVEGDPGYGHTKNAVAARRANRKKMELEKADELLAVVGLV